MGLCAAKLPVVRAGGGHAIIEVPLVVFRVALVRCPDASKEWSARDVAGVTPVELASRVNAAQTFISKCECGERRLDIVELKQWCEAIGLSLVELAVRSEDACNKPG